MKTSQMHPRYISDDVVSRVIKEVLANDQRGTKQFLNLVESVSRVE